MKVTIDEALAEWESKPRRMGCGRATNWFCKRVKGFRPLRFPRAAGGVYWEHVVAYDGKVIIDLSPQNDAPEGVDMSDGGYGWLET